MRRPPPLSSCRASEATARLGSVTRHPRSLREAAGFSLFQKAGTGLRLNGRLVHHARDFAHLRRQPHGLVSARVPELFGAST